LPCRRAQHFSAVELAAIHEEFQPVGATEQEPATSLTRLQVQLNQAEEHAEQVFAQNKAAGPEQHRLITIAQQHVQLFEGRLRRARRGLVQLQTQRAFDQAADLALAPLADAEKVARHRIRLRRLALSEASSHRAWLRLHGQCNAAMAKAEAVDAVRSKAKVVQDVFDGEETINAGAKLKAAENAVQGCFEKYEAVWAHWKMQRVEVGAASKI
jgi:hypothetical protein